MVSVALHVVGFRGLVGLEERDWNRHIFLFLLPESGIVQFNT